MEAQFNWFQASTYYTAWISTYVWSDHQPQAVKVEPRVDRDRLPPYPMTIPSRASLYRMCNWTWVHENESKQMCLPTIAADTETRDKHLLISFDRAEHREETKGIPPMLLCLLLRPACRADYWLQTFTRRWLQLCRSCSEQIYDTILFTWGNKGARQHDALI